MYLHAPERASSAYSSAVPKAEVKGHIGAPHSGETVVHFTATPSFQAEWGLRIIRGHR